MRRPCVVSRLRHMPTGVDGRGGAEVRGPIPGVQDGMDAVACRPLQKRSLAERFGDKSIFFPERPDIWPARPLSAEATTSFQLTWPEGSRRRQFLQHLTRMRPAGALSQLAGYTARSVPAILALA